MRGGAVAPWGHRAECTPAARSVVRLNVMLSAVEASLVPRPSESFASKSFVGVSHARWGATGNERADWAHFQSSGAWQSLVPRPRQSVEAVSGGHSRAATRDASTALGMTGEADPPTERHCEPPYSRVQKCRSLAGLCALGQAKLAKAALVARPSIVPGSQSTVLTIAVTSDRGRRHRTAARRSRQSIAQAADLGRVEQ